MGSRQTTVAGMPITRLLTLVTISFGLGMMTWLLASPVGSSPDEPAHITYAWGLSTGQGPGGPDPACEPYGQCPLTFYDVPDGLVPDPACYRFDTSVTVECRTTAASPASTAATRYPPPFYIATGLGMRAALGAGASPEGALLVARAISAVIAGSLFVGAIAAALRLRRGLAGMVLIVTTPMAFFLSASVNPNGVEIAAAVSVAVIFAASTKPPTGAVLGLFAWSSFWLAWSRPVGWLWLLLVVLFGLGIQWLRTRPTGVREFVVDWRWTLASTAIGGCTAFGWTLYALGAHASRADTGVTLPLNPGGRRVALILRLGDMTTEALGSLGWLDTTIPSIMRLVLLFSLFGAIVLSLAHPASVSERRVSLAYLITVVALIVFIMNRQSFLWQGRYALPPIAAGLIYLVGSGTDDHRSIILRLGGISWIVSAASALWLYARYAFGLTRGPRFAVPNLDLDAQWTPTGGIGLFLGLTVLTCITGTAAVRSIMRFETDAAQLNADTLADR